MTPLDWLLASLVVGFGLALWRQIVVANEWRVTCISYRDRLADEAVELLRLRSTLRTIDYASAVTLTEEVYPGG